MAVRIFYEKAGDEGLRRVSRVPDLQFNGCGIDGYGIGQALACLRVHSVFRRSGPRYRLEAIVKVVKCL